MRPLSLPQPRPPARRRRLLAAGVAIAIGLPGLGACTADPIPAPTVTAEPTPPPQPPGPTLDPDRPSTTFAVPRLAQVEVNGLLVVANDGTIDQSGHQDMSFTVSGEGFEELRIRGEVGQVAEIPGWGLLTVERVEGDPVTDGGGRPPTILHFRAQTETPLEFTSTFSLGVDYGLLRITDLRIDVREDGTESNGIASFVINSGWTDEIQVEGPAGTVVEVPDWGKITVVDLDTAQDPADGVVPLGIQTVTDFVVTTVH